MQGQQNKPKIFMMGEEVPYDSLPEPEIDLAAYFLPVRISPRAIDLASKIVPAQYWVEQGIHDFLSERANKVFAKLASHEREGKWGKLRYIFDFDDKGPVLKTVSL